MTLASNVKWVALSQVVKVGLQLISLTVLTRLLAPTEYGLMAMATVVINFTMIIRDLGTAAAIIQRKELAQSTISTVFWLNIIMGILICLGIMLASPLIASLFNAPSLVPVLLLLALSFPIASSTSVHQALLERESEFRRVAGVEIKSAAVGLIVAIGMAYSGFGVYSLVGQTIMSCALSSLGLWRISKWRPTKVFDKVELRSLFGFSGNLTAFNLVNYFSRNADSMIIGHFFSAAVLGAYSLAYRVMLFPLQSLTFVTTRSLYPLMSRQQEEPETIKLLYLKVILVIASITAPMMAGLAVLREPFVHFVFGEQWSLVPSLLLWLAPTGFIQSIVSTTGSVFMAKGKTKLLMKLGVLSSILMVGAFIIGGQHNVHVLAMLYLWANIINCIPALIYAMRTLGGKLKELLLVMLAPVFSTLLMTIVLYVIVKNLDVASWLTFVSLIAMGIAIYVATYRLIFPSATRRILPIRLFRYFLL